MQKFLVISLPAVAFLTVLGGCSHSHDKDASPSDAASTTVAQTPSDAPQPAATPAVAVVPGAAAPATTTTAQTAVTQPAVVTPRAVNLHPTTYIIHKAPLVGGGGAASTADTVQLVVRALSTDTSLRGAHIRVTPEVSTIRLEGTVNSVAQKNRAEEIVIAVQKQSRRQTGVENELVVNEPPRAQAAAAAAGGGPVEVP